MSVRAEQDKWLRDVLNRTPDGDVVAEEKPASMAAGAGAPPPPPSPPGKSGPPDAPPPPDGKPQENKPPEKGKKPRAVITWNPPPAVDWTPGGITLDGTQLNATTEPPNLALVYNPAAGARLGVATHDLSVALDADVPYEADPVQVQLVVRKPRAVITWAEPKGVAWTQGGFTPGKDQLNATVAPQGPAITYTPETKGPLPVGDHRITASLADTENAAADPLTITLKVTKAPATIEWDQPAEVPWVEGGVTPGPSQLNASTTPPGIRLTYKPETEGPLGVGPHQITASIADTEPYEAAPKTVTLKIGKGKAVITWPQPKSVRWAAGGITPGPEQLNAVTVPPGLAVTYPDLPKGPLAPGSYPVTATLDHASYDAAPVARTLVIDKAPHGLAWSQRLAADFTPGGLLMGAKFKGAVKNPNQLDLVFTPPLGTRFNTIGPQPLSVTHTDPTNYDPTPLVGTLDIRQGKATITLRAPQRLRTGNDGTIVFDPAILNAATVPPGLALAYYPDSGEVLRPGTSDFAVGLADTVTDFVAVTATAKIQIEDGRPRGQQPQQGDAPAQERPAVVIPDGEYPYGGPNLEPHIHRYGDEFHVQIHHRGRVRRYNIVQGGARHAQADTALEASEGNNALHGMIQAIIDQYG